jgi:spore coat protein CotH
LIPASSVRRLTKLVLRGGHNDDTNPFIKDELMRRLFADCGHVSSKGTFVNLFLNGEYRGYYNPVQRLDQDFFQEATGSEEEWDVIRQDSAVADGDNVEWNYLLSLVKFRDLSVPQNYAEVTARLDVVNLVDYLLVNIYGATGDWPANNWTVARERIPGGKFSFCIWDAEAAFGALGNTWTTNTVFSSLEQGSSEVPRIYRALVANTGFRRLFASRFRTQFYENGGLTDANVMAHFQSLRVLMQGVIPIVDTAIPATWIPLRRGEVVTQLAMSGLLERIDAPSTSAPSFIAPPILLPRPVPGNPDLLGDGRIDARDLFEFEEQRRGSHSP